MTSLETDTTPGDHLDMMVAEGGSFHLLRTPRLPVSVNGAGDAIAALFLFHRLRSGSAVTALEAAGSSVHGLLRRTAEAGAREIQLVAAQDEFVAPSRLFQAVPCEAAIDHTPALNNTQHRSRRLPDYHSGCMVDIVPSVRGRSGRRSVRFAHQRFGPQATLTARRNSSS